MKTLLGLAVVLLPASLPMASYGENLIVNGDFEQGNVGFTTDYSVGNLDYGNVYQVITSQTATGVTVVHDHTSGQGNMMVVNGSTTPNRVWQETVDVMPNTAYDFGFWATCWSGYDAHGDQTPFLEYSINGTVLGTMTVEFDRGVWRQAGARWNSGSEQTATITIIDRQYQTWAGDDFVLDDITFSAVPEPGSLALLGAGGIWVLRRRRRG